MLPTWGSGDAVTDWSIAAIQGAKEAAVGHRIFLVVGTFFHPPEGNTFLVFKRFYCQWGDYMLPTWDHFALPLEVEPPVFQLT